jgi:hypothetical protein
MASPVKMAFEPEGIILPIDRILPLKQVKPSEKKLKKYQRILSSVNEVGIVEPLIVHPQNGKEGKYLLLDGHLRLEAIRDLGQNEVLCLISTDDEAFTYNHKVSYLSSIQEHFMILKAIKNGVSEERIAKTLNVDVAKIKEKRNLLEGICPEAIDLLKDRQITPNALKVLKKVLAMRQIELAELMVAANNYTVPYAKALLAATPSNQLIEQDKKKKVDGLSQEEMVRMEKEMNRLEREFKAIEESYGPNVLNLVVARRYLTNLLDNARVSRFLSQNYSEVLTEFQKIIEATSLES